MTTVDGVRPEPRLRPEPRPRHHTLHLLVVVPVLLAALATASLAFWSGSGTGTGTATSAADSLGLTLTPGTPSTTLFPGSSADVAVTLSNPNRAAVRVGSLALDSSQGTGGFAVDGGHSGCDVSALHVTTSTAGWTVPARTGGTDGSLPVTLGGALAMDSSAGNACQGATFSVYLSAVG